ncbi:MAG: transcriptional regulator [Tissierellia bacterium]|nr:transcriptional regulator [Tissierellia bacterium]
MTKLDRNWSKIFHDYDILRKIEKNNFYKITSKEINRYRTARLMTKFDHRSNLPKLFKDNNLSILPTKRGEYILSTFDAYQDLPPVTDTIDYVEPRADIYSIDTSDIYSEAISLNYALLSGILMDFFEVEEINHTLSGRMGSSNFKFNIFNTKINSPFEVYVQNSQVEIDGGYETREALYIIEAKNSVPSDFLIRQLYYPYRLWHDKFKSLNLRKRVVPIFFTYSNDIWNIFEYEFQDPNDYNSLVLIKQNRYMLEPEKITLDNIKDILYTIDIVDEPRDIPYPQADTFERIINMLEIFMLDMHTKEHLIHNFNTDSLDPRQIDYYLNSCRYLGLVEEHEENNLKYYRLTELGNSIMQKDFKFKYLEIVKCILKNPSFNESTKKYIELDGHIGKRDIVEIMKRNGVHGVESESTFYRRATTVLAWIRWIMGLVSI